MTRDERQNLAIKRWVEAKGKGVIIATTGLGKTRIALKIIKLLQSKKDSLKIKILVPTIILKEQWKEEIKKFNLKEDFIFVEVMMGSCTVKDSCDLLILDELHLAYSEHISAVFQNISYKYILGLTATIERLDGREKLFEHYAPICDRISVKECLDNGWIAPFKEYLVLINVPDLEDYKKLNKDFTAVFEFFDFDFNLAMSCIGPKGVFNCLKLRDKLCPYNATKKQKADMLKLVKLKAIQFTRILQKRKAFIANHPKKIEIAQKIINARQDKKIVTFSKTIKMAEKIPTKYIYTGDKGPKNNKKTLETFNSLSSGVLSTSKMAVQGLDCPDISVGICLDVDSSTITAIQKLGRCVRFVKDKQAEFFTIVINNCVEVQWWQKSHTNAPNIIKIDEEGLDQVLKGETPREIKNLQNYQFRW